MAPEFTASAARPTSTANCRVDLRDVNLSHLHHRIKDALGDNSIRAGDRLRQGDRRNLPVQTPSVFAPATLALFAAARDDGVPVAVRFGLIGGCDLKRERPVVIDTRAAVESDTGNANHRELDGQYVSLLPRRKVGWRSMHRADGGIGESLGVKSCSLLGAAIVPKTDLVFHWCHFTFSVN